MENLELPKLSDDALRGYCRELPVPAPADAMPNLMKWWPSVYLRPAEGSAARLDPVESESAL
jgi:hypothetical protein